MWAKVGKVLYLKGILLFYGYWKSEKDIKDIAMGGLEKWASFLSVL